MSTTADPVTNPAAMAPALLRAKHACRYCAVSVASWHRLDSAGKIPEGMALGGAKVWSRVEIEAWVAAGMPDRAAWALVRSQRKISP